MDRLALEKYIKEAARMPLQGYSQLVAMVILHFDIPDKEAEELVWRWVVSNVRRLEELEAQVKQCLRTIEEYKSILAKQEAEISALSAAMVGFKELDAGKFVTLADLERHMEEKDG